MEKEKLEVELADLRAAIRELDFSIEDLDKRLAPVRAAEIRVRNEILGTHGSETAQRTVKLDGRPVEKTLSRVVYQFEGKDGRARLYEELLMLAEIHGASKTKRTELSLERKAARARIKQLAWEIKRWKPPGPQGSLFEWQPIGDLANQIVGKFK